jgi:hypothetical protein
MEFVREVLANDRRLTSHSWEVVRSEMVRLKNLPHSTLFLGGPKGQMIIEFVEDKGFYIRAFGQGELEEWLAVDEQLPADWIKVDISGHVDDMPRRVLVSEDIALDLAKEFYFSGKRASGRLWVRSIDLMNDTRHGPR